MAILVLAEHDNRSLKSSTSHVVTAAQKLGSDIDILIIESTSVSYNSDVHDSVASDVVGFIERNAKVVLLI